MDDFVGQPIRIVVFPYTRHLQESSGFGVFRQAVHLGLFNVVGAQNGVLDRRYLGRHAQVEALHCKVRQRIDDADERTLLHDVVFHRRHEVEELTRVRLHV